MPADDPDRPHLRAEPDEPASLADLLTAAAYKRAIAELLAAGRRRAA